MSLKVENKGSVTTLNAALLNTSSMADRQEWSRTDYLDPNPYGQVFKVPMKALSTSSVSLTSLSLLSCPDFRWRDYRDVCCNRIDFTWLELQLMRQTNIQQRFAELIALTFHVQQGRCPKDTAWYEPFGAFAESGQSGAEIRCRALPSPFVSHGALSTYSDLAPSIIQVVQLPHCERRCDQLPHLPHQHSPLTRHLRVRNGVSRVGKSPAIDQPL